jgi:cell division topological specificity factor
VGFDFKALFRRKKASKAIAKSRLHFVLVQDRAGLTNEEMINFRKEMLDVIEKYFVIDKHAFDIEYKRGSDTTTLVINSPIIVRRQDGLRHEAGARIRRKSPHVQPEPQQAL